MCWKYFLPVYDVLKLCLGGFLNNEALNFHVTALVCSSVL